MDCPLYCPLYCSLEADVPRVSSCRLNAGGVAAIQKKYKEGRWANVSAFCRALSMKRDTYYELIRRDTWFEPGTIREKLGSMGISEADQSGLIEFKDEAYPCLNNLPQQLTSFIGREKEKADVKTLLSKSRLLTLTGAGGCGKTRLALQVANELLEKFPDGIRFVELAALTDPDLVPQTLLSVLGLCEEPGRSFVETITAYLKSRTLLLILDNCEHLIAACDQLAIALLRDCPQVKILATSRETRSVTGEIVYRVPSLSLPDNASMSLPEAEVDIKLARYDAVRLFVERAHDANPDLVLDGQNGPDIAKICRRLDGIPLAIELAAARVRSLSIEAIHSQLDKSFRLLTSNSPTALARQRTIRATIDWSYSLLNDKERALLDRLSVFRGGWRLEAVAPVCVDDGMENWEVVDLLTSLVDKSLVIFEARDAQKRYRLLETVREYGTERLVETEEAEAVRKRHRNYFQELATEAEPKLIGLDQTEWLQRLEAEHDNLRAALDWSLSDLEEPAGLRICGALSRFWSARGHLSEGREWCVQILAAASTEALTVDRAKTLNVAGNLARLQSDYASARALFEESLVISRKLGDKRGIAHSLNGLGLVAYAQSDYASARKPFEESLAMSQQLGEKQDRAMSLNNMSFIDLVLYHLGLDRDQGADDAALARYEERLAIFRELGDKKSIAEALSDLGELFRNRSNYDKSRVLFEESLAISRELGDKRGIAMSLLGLGHIGNKHDLDSAEKLHEESVAICRELGDKGAITLTLGSQADMLRNRGDYDAARILIEECLAINRELQNTEGIAWTLRGLGYVELEQGRYREAGTRFEESLAMFQPNCRLGVALSFTDLGYVVHGQGDYSAAKVQYEMSEQIFRELDDKPCIAMTHNNLGLVAYDQGDYVLAKIQYEQGLILFRELGDKKRIAESMESFAGLAAMEGQPLRAARLWGVAEGLRAIIGVPVPPYQRPRMERPMTAAREAIGEERFVVAWLEGRSMDLEQAIDYALEAPVE